MKFLKKALSFNDVLPEAHLTLGRIYDKRQEDELAIEQFKVAIKQSLNTQFHKVNMQSHFYLGCQHERKKEIKQAIYHFK
jgi:tetratricopeptide (TPR) repeat protein